MKKVNRRKIVATASAFFLAVSSIFGNGMTHANASTNAAKAKEIVSKMTLEEKIGQKLMLSFRSGWTMEDGTHYKSVQNINDEIYQIIGNYDIGSVILFAANFDPDATVNVELIDGLQRAAMDKSLGKNAIPLLIGTDQEGGIVYRLTGGTALPGNMALGASGNVENAFKAGEIIGSELSAIGVNMNFGPVTDVNNNPNNPVIGLRSFSSDPQIVSKFANAYIEGVQSKNVATSAKHFPGHGNVATDSHTGLPSIDSTKEELYATELVPFKSAIEQGTDMVMTAHIQFPNVVTEKIYSDKKQEYLSPPATLSREILTDLLRGEMGFDGVIVTDSMTMDGVANYFDVNERNLLAVKAGVDILDIPFNDMASMADVESKLVPLIDAFVEAYTSENGYNGIKLSQEELNASVERIITLKLNRGVMDLANDTQSLEEKKAVAKEVVGSVKNRETERLISANAVTVVKNENNTLPLKLTKNSKILFASTYSRNNNRFVLAWERAKKAGIIPEGADYKILQHYNLTGLDDKVNSAINSDGSAFNGTNRDLLDWCDTLVHASEISSATDISGYKVACPQLFIDYCEGLGKQTVAISLNHPYDVQSFTKADAVVAVFGTNGLGLDITESFGGGTVGATAAFSPNLTGGVEVILGTFGASGKLPVDIPKYDPSSKSYTDEIVYQLGYGLTYDSIVKDADKTELQAIIEKVNTLDFTKFTADSLNKAQVLIDKMTEKLRIAENVNITHKLSQKNVDETAQELQKAYDEVLKNLIYATDKSQLQALVDALLEENLQKDKFTSSTWKAYEAALLLAQEVLASNVDQNTINDALSQLKRAREGLVTITEEDKKADKQELQALLEKYNTYKAKDYTTESWNVFKGVLDRANQIYQDDQVNQETVDAVVEELKSAASKLIKVDEKQDNTSDIPGTGQQDYMLAFTFMLLLSGAVIAYIRRKGYTKH
ncbi:glycoside hydrolase family 3 protein [Amedibacillus dolichus]|nr:glycoside hydrolase family 3 protein [Amedibacillus dolichus]MCB5373850.1 glycoside hydrolase family 3 protein [Amedibacillus dolichus]